MAKHIFKELEGQKLAIFAGSADQGIGQIAAVFRKNMEEEERINEEARKLLEMNKRKAGLNLDEERAFLMIKKQLAKQKNFVL
ncbi:MAG: DUF507 family protein [Deltaproteobacteria bacterium]|nr:DUF507 family protein [Deltaproteobacteria bacterium]